MEKFYSDVLRAGKTSEEKMINLFLKKILNYDKSLEPVAKDMISYWEFMYKGKKTTEESVDFYYELFCFLTCNFEELQNFSKYDWKELLNVVVDSQNDLDIDLLENYMSAFLEHGII